MGMNISFTGLQDLVHFFLNQFKRKHVECHPQIMRKRNIIEALTNEDINFS